MSVTQAEIADLLPSQPFTEPLLADVPLAEIEIDDNWASPDTSFRESLRHGLIAPVMLERLASPYSGIKFRVIAGRRRVLAALELEWPTISAAILEAGQANPHVVALAENYLRSHHRLNEYEHAAALRDDGWTEAQIAAAVGMSTTQVRALFRTGDRMSNDLKDAVKAKAIPYSAAEIAVTLPASKQKRLVERLKSGEKVTLKDVREERQVQADDALHELPMALFGEVDEDEGIELTYQRFTRTARTLLDAAAALDGDVQIEKAVKPLRTWVEKNGSLHDPS